MTTLPVLEANLSLFEQVTRIVEAPLFTQSRPNLIKVSHEIENGVLHGTSGARVFAGFQKLSFLLPIIDRYRMLATVAESVWVFGLPDTDEIPDIPGLNVVPLTEDHALAGEWFLVVESSTYFSALVAHDLSGFDVPQRERLFEGVWTFNANSVEQVQKQLSRLVDIEPITFSPQQRNYNVQTTRFSTIANQLVRTLQKRNDDLVRTQHLHNQLFNMIVHDLRNPLAGMMGFIDLIELGLNDSAYRPDLMLEFVQETRRSYADLSILIDNILDIHKIEAGKFPVIMENFAVQPLLSGLCSQYTGLAGIRRISLDILLQQSDLVIHADANVLQRVLANLLSNAIRHTSQGGVTLSAEKQNGHVLLMVKDTGEGIDPEDLPHVFSPYYQGNASRTRGAVGLGLTFCLRAVDAMNGKIDVHNNSDAGSTFTVRLPRVN